MSASSLSLRDRVLGCVLGGAIGDAWGRPYEGEVGPLTFQKPSTSFTTDDTELTLATCEAIVRDRTCPPEVVADAMADRYRRGLVHGAGASTLKALRDLAAGSHWALAGAKGEYSAGNGAAMRVAPLAFVLDPTDATDRRTIRDIARITHHHEESYVAALSVVFAAKLASSGCWDLVRFRETASALPDSRVRDAMLRIDEHWTVEAVASALGVSGFAAESVPFALFASLNLSAHTPLDVIREVIECGGDTDTNASIVGNVLGAQFGTNAWAGAPSTLRAQKFITEAANEFADAVAG